MENSNGKTPKIEKGVEIIANHQDVFLRVWDMYDLDTPELLFGEKFDGTIEEAIEKGNSILQEERAKKNTIFAVRWWDCWEGNVESLHRTLEGALAKIKELEKKDNQNILEHIKALEEEIEETDDEDLQLSLNDEIDNRRGSLFLKEKELTDRDIENGYVKKFYFDEHRGYDITKEKVYE